MGDVPHGPEHDADVAARGAAETLARKKLAALIAFDLVALVVVVGLAWLAIWQLHRRAWKLELIARVEARVHAAPTPAPGPESWPTLSAASDEYRRVVARGHWRQNRTALVQALTELGGGYWVLTPLALNDGSIVFVNRGFVPIDKRDQAFWREEASGPVTVTGLLRLSEPGGGFLRPNEVGSDRWYSRDLAAIAASRGLARFAPYFIDAERAPGAVGLPAAGLTVLTFPNNHLVYALTWGVLAVMAAAGTAFFNVQVLQTQHRSREAGLSES
jgi:surfeit locus 1 family protein